MNRIFLIGNGFDLAHGMATSFDDFVKDLIRNRIDHQDNVQRRILNISIPKDNHGHFVINSKRINFEQEIRLILRDIVALCNTELIDRMVYAYQTPVPKNSIIRFSNALFEEIIYNLSINNWVEFEHNYYKKLLRIVKAHSSNEITLCRLIYGLNDNFSDIKLEFTDYIGKTMKVAKRVKSDSFQSLFLESRIRGRNKLHGAVEKHKVEDNLILNFNYTDTILRYSMPQFTNSDNELEQAEIINIHGEVNNPNNPIIFGYGDEMEENYSIIEAFNNDRIQEHFKSVHYSRTDNYHKLEGFLGLGDFWVVVMGHSCGISDRVLLQEIFQSVNCKGITIHHYPGIDNDSGERHHREIFTHISRCFSLEHKSKVRSKVIPFRESNRCPQVSG